jgi:thiazole synthase ThiGH ThiG subunit
LISPRYGASAPSISADSWRRSLPTGITRFLLPSTAGCHNVEDAIRTARLSREAGLSKLREARTDRRGKTLVRDSEELLAMELGADGRADERANP